MTVNHVSKPSAANSPTHCVLVHWCSEMTCKNKAKIIMHEKQLPLKPHSYRNTHIYRKSRRQKTKTHQQQQKFDHITQGKLWENTFKVNDKTKWMPWRTYAKQIGPFHLRLRSQAVTQICRAGWCQERKQFFYFLSSLSEDWVVHFIPFEAQLFIFECFSVEIPRCTLIKVWHALYR